MKSFAIELTDDIVEQLKKKWVIKTDAEVRNALEVVVDLYLTEEGIRINKQDDKARKGGK